MHDGLLALVILTYIAAAALYPWAAFDFAFVRARFQPCRNVAPKKNLSSRAQPRDLLFRPNREILPASIATIPSNVFHVMVKYSRRLPRSTCPARPSISPSAINPVYVAPARLSPSTLPYVAADDRYTKLRSVGGSL